MKWENRSGVDFYLDDESKVLAIIFRTCDEMYPYTYIHIDSGENDAFPNRLAAKEKVETEYDPKLSYWVGRTYRDYKGLCLASIRNAKKGFLLDVSDRQTEWFETMSEAMMYTEKLFRPAAEEIPF